jgi:hypothetical protein
MAGEGKAEEVVNWDGVLTQDERRRILSRLHDAFGAVGARIPDTIELGGRQLRLADTVFDYLGKDSLTARELDEVAALLGALESKLKEDERRIKDGRLTESGAVDLMKEVLGILRALDHLRSIRGDSKSAGPARESLMKRVDDDRRWLEFVKKVR